MTLPDAAPTRWELVCHHARAIRVPEVTLMVGLFVIGGVFSFDPTAWPPFGRLLLYGIGAWCFVASVYAMNAYGGYREDLKNPRFRGLTHVNPSFFVAVALLGLASFCVLFTAIDGRILAYAMGSYLLWFLYCFPTYGLKHYPITGACVHFASQICHFQMSYVLFQPVDRRALLVAIYFATVWAGAYLNHEIIDHRSDKEGRVNTSAVWFGLRAADVGSIALFGIGAGYWVALAATNVIAPWESIPFLTVFAIQAATKVAFGLKGTGTLGNPVLYRALYRTYYGLAVAGYVALKVSRG